MVLRALGRSEADAATESVLVSGEGEEALLNAWEIQDSQIMHYA